MLSKAPLEKPPLPADFFFGFAHGNTPSFCQIRKALIDARRLCLRIFIKKITNHKSKLFFVIGNLLSPGLPLELEAEGYLGHEQSLLVGPLIPERSYYLAAQSDSKSLAGA